jgi:hypothetical protein
MTETVIHPDGRPSVSLARLKQAKWSKRIECPDGSFFEIFSMRPIEEVATDLFRDAIQVMSKPAVFVAK